MAEGASSKRKMTSIDLYPSLLDACGRGDVNTVKYLMNEGLDVNHVDKEGNCPLLMAITFGKVEVVRFLFENGADVDHLNSRKEPIVFKGKYSDLADMVKLLNMYGVREAVIPKEEEETVSSVSSKMTSIDLYPSLLDACGRGDVNTVKYLVNEGLDVNHDKEGNCPLLMAITFGKVEVVRFLFEHGADVDLLNSRKEPVVFKGKYSDLADMVKLLKKNRVREAVIPKTETVSSVSSVASSSSSSNELEQRLDIHSLRHVYRLLYSLAPYWMDIGIFLMLEMSTLRTIERDYRGRSVECLREVLSVWLKRSCPPPTWKDLIEAIEPIDPFQAEKIRDHALK